MTKRILAILGMALATLFLLGLAACTIGVWLVKPPLINLAGAVFTPAGRVLALADGRLTQVDQRLGQAQERLQTAEANVNQIGSDLEENSLILNVISQTVGAELIPIVTQVRDDAAAVRDLVETANETVQSLNNLPFLRAEVPGTDALQALVDSIAAAERAVEELRTTIQAARVERILRSGSAADAAVASVTDAPG
jgi:hypothetical protein